MTRGRFLVGFVLLAVAARGFTIWDAPRFNFEELAPVREHVLTAASDGQVTTPTNVMEVQWQRFDPQARVRLLPGPDQFPGGANVDDNANGVVDDAGELGATHSDDVCIVEASNDEPLTIQPSVVLQRGAFIPAPLNDVRQLLSQETKSVADSASPTLPIPNSIPEASAIPMARAIVFGQTDDQPWSFLVDLTAFHTEAKSPQLP